MDEAVASRCRPPPVSLVVVVLVVFGLLPAGSVGATSQGPVADGPYVGTLPCADCAGIRTTLTLHSMGEGGLPIAYRMTRTWLGTPAGERSEEQLGPWMRLRQDDGELIRIEPYSDARRQSFRRLGPDELVLLDRGEQLIVTSHALGLKRDMHAEPPRLTPPRTLFRGVLVRESGALLFAPCGVDKPLRFRDASPEAVITAAITDAGFDSAARFYLEGWGGLHEGELRLDRLNRGGAGMDCAEARAGFRAEGDGAGWRLVSDRSGVSFVQSEGEVLRAPPIPLSWRWRGGRAERAEALLSVSTERTALEVSLRPRICHDAETGAVHGFVASVTVHRPEPMVEYRGCAHLGTEPLY